LWKEIESSYSAKSRHYHTLYHLKDLLQQLEQVRSEIANWDTVLFTLYYHDVVYNSRKGDNEERSAQYAIRRMKELGVPLNITGDCEKQIIATKSHQVSESGDTNLFTDADLSILGRDWEVYQRYTGNIRKEYAIYPDLIYKPGRRKVLRHFLAMERIFKTRYFYDKFERQARQNIEGELALL
jgi:predicted metal-dependent HD superfamily phosphohydrolase